MIALAATLWLAATGRLGLYIHPRYFVFTTVLAVISVVLVVAATAFLGASDEHDEHGHDDDDGHGHEEDGPATSLRARLLRCRPALVTATAVLIVATATVGLLVLPPSTLTTATANTRQVNTGALTAAVPTGDTANYSVKDWAALLAQGETEQFFAGRSATISGFVSPDPDDPTNVFYVTRFVVTCCAVDAQPVGVPIYQPGWEQKYAIDSWLEVTGGFGSNPSITSAQSIVLDPVTETPIAEPSMPYVY
ncbi:MULTISPECIES: TIGR03943 family putative permease subunit [unclassified Rathayibacter]|uniref:TIGR03943 family putative permease subunit n=1 Tax=unclassified Rathayibacter TaxID=2609250 RepID=UPI00188D6B6B|nr:MULTISPECIES: TIGR03943 family protein [unclassified Rathayibacter]MBF4461238.1 TIGR03943 family protein [Rathayibacter sp. VKM Ac-2879]MBF4502649.1 TIGR03943 family protein [Rathayibacter sp. VKM Ac-2878]